MFSNNNILYILLLVLIIVLIIYNSFYLKKNKENFRQKLKPKYNIYTNIKPIIYNPNKNNAIVTLYTDNIKDYAIHSIKNFKRYCNEHNLSLYIFNKGLSNDILHGCWNKIPAILYLLNNTNHKYIIWMDIDAVFNRLDISFNKYIDNYKDKNMIVCRDIKDEKYKFNSGVMIIKNNTWSKKIFEDTWNSDVPHGYGRNGDQVILKNIIIENGKNNFDSNSGNKNTVLLAEREFNSFPRDDNHQFGPYTDNDFIVHYMGHKTRDRVKYISAINKKLNIT